MFTKKILLVFTAIVMATALVWATGVTNKKPILAPVTMYYHGATFNQADVQNKANWNTTAQQCQEGDDLACQVTVDNSLISGGSFISTVSLDAEPGTASALLGVKNSGTPQDADIINRE